MTVYPAMLDLTGRRVVVVGAGPVGMRKVAAMTHAGADVRLVAPRIPGAEELVGVECVAAGYDRSQLDGAVLVFACTDEPGLNSRIARDARHAGALVNVADEPKECDFFAAATIVDGEVVVAVSTGGCAPGLAKRVAGRLSTAMPARLGEFAELLGDCRSIVRSAVAEIDRRRRIMNELSGEGAYDLFIEHGPQAVRDRLGELLKG